MKQYIASNPQVMGGMPVIAGTRVPVSRIIFLLKEGYTVAAIHDEFPHVTREQIDGAVTEVVKLLTDKAYAEKISQI